MSSAAQLSILGFGVTAFGAGCLTLFNPAQSLHALNLPDDAVTAMRGNALASIAMGIYYTLAAYQDNVSFYKATVPMRALTCAVFWLQGWYAASVWEGAGSLITALSLWRDEAKGKTQ